MKSLKPLIRLALYLLITVLFVYGIIAAKQFLYPMVFGLLFAYLLYPVVNFLEKKGIPRIVANLISIILTLAIIAVLVFFIYKQFSRMFEDFSTFRKTAISNVELLQSSLENWLGLNDNKVEQFLKEQVNFFFSRENGGFNKIFSATTGTVFKLVLLPIYVFLFLYYRTKFAYFILKIVKKKN